MFQAAWLKNQGLRNTRETSLAKWHATDHSVQAALDAIQIHGANGYSNEFPVEGFTEIYAIWADGVKLMSVQKRIGLPD